MTGGQRRFVHVFATFGAGGPQVRAMQLMQHLGAGHRHVVMAMDGHTEAAAMLPAAVAVELVPPPPRRGLLRNVRAMRRWLQSMQPDLVLTYNWGAIETVMASRRLGLPIVHHEDGFGPEEVERRLRRRSWLRRFALWSVPVVVPSVVLQGIAQRDWRLRAEHVHHLPNGVDLERFRPQPSPLLDFVIGTVGGLRAEKDHSTLLRATAALDERVRLCLVGGGPLAAALQREAATLGLGARVEFTGPVHDPTEHYARMSVFALSSRTEQMPLALLEAMACGLPVVATDVGDVRAILPIEAHDFVVPAGDARAFAAALQRLTAEPQLRRTLGAANRRRVEDRYEANTCLSRFAALYAAAQA